MEQHIIYANILNFFHHQINIQIIDFYNIINYIPNSSKILKEVKYMDRTSKFSQSNLDHQRKSNVLYYYSTILR